MSRSGRTGVPRHAGAACWRSGPAQLVEAVVVDPEVVGDLVDDGHGDLLDQFLAGGAPALERAAEDEDAVGQDHGPALVALGQGSAVIEAQQGGTALLVVVLGPEHVGVGLVLDEDDHIVHGLGQVPGDLVQGVADRLLEVLLGHAGHMGGLAHGRSLPRLLWRAAVRDGHGGRGDRGIAHLCVSEKCRVNPLFV